MECHMMGIANQEIPLPHKFLRWQSECRLAVIDQLQRKGATFVTRHPAHLPIIATWGEGKFPVNLACKGMGPLPRPENIVGVTEQFEAVQEKYASEPVALSLPARLEIARTFYSDPLNFDPRQLGGLEIFEGCTLSNLRRRPVSSLLFVGEGPGYCSFQLNGVMELVEENDLRRRFLLAARTLFANDSFHISQAGYSYGCLFRPWEIREKTPFTKGRH